MPDLFAKSRLDALLADVTTGHGAATAAATTTDLNLGFATKVSDLFSLSAFAQKSWGGGWTAAAQASLRW